MSICPNPTAIRFFKDSKSFRFSASGGFPVIFAGEAGSNFDLLHIDSDKLRIWANDSYHCLFFNDVDRLEPRNIEGNYVLVLYKKIGKEVELHFPSNFLQEFRALWTFMVS